MFEKDRQHVVGEFGWFLDKHGKAVVTPANIILVSWVLFREAFRTWSNALSIYLDHLVDDSNEFRNALRRLLALANFAEDVGHCR